MTDETCKVLRVTSYGRGASALQELLNSGRRLEIRDANNEMQARFVGEWCRVSGSLDVAGDQLKFKRQRRAPDNDE